MKSFLIFIGGFVAGILATFLFAYLISVTKKPNDGLLGLKLFPKQGECITTNSKNKSCEIVVFKSIAQMSFSDYKILFGQKNFMVGTTPRLRYKK